MAFSTIALYVSGPGSICSTPHSFQINAHSSCDFDFNTRSSSSPPPTIQKPVIGGLSSLFSSNSTRHASSTSTFSGCGEELGSVWHDRGEEWKEFSSSSTYSLTNKFFGSSSIRDQSPVSVFHGPVSCCSSGTDSSVRSPPSWITREKSGDVSFQSSTRGGSTGLFNGFTRKNSLETFVDYDSPSFQLHGDGDNLAINSSALIDELAFNMDNGIVECDPEPYAKDLLVGAQLRYKIFFDDLVIKAFYEAEKAHKGQMRASGDPYLQHCVETAMLLARVGANSTVVAAGLLHDTLDDSFLCYDDILLSFGAGVADLVEGVSKLSQLSKLARENNTASKTVEADRLHTMFLAIADPKAVLIKLADRLHNMMTLDALPMAKQQRFAKETLEIFAPLSNRVGISSWKEQLENLCFKHLNPGEHKNLSSKLLESSDEAMIASAIGRLEKALKDEGISYNLLSGRHKTVYSIYRKMLKKKLTMDEIHDIHGLRLIVDNDDDCYSALRVVHALWSEVPGKLKDYIAHPKFNGYRSLHTVVTDESMVPIEVQIRTKEMHLQAEFGFAAHWRYKEGDCEHPLFVLEMVERARSILTCQCESMSKAQSSFDSFPSQDENCPQPHCQNGPIFVIMLEKNKMSIQELPVNSTIMDVLQKAGQGSLRWMPYGLPVKEYLRPRLNHKPTNPWCKLKMGDIVELTPSIPNKSLTVYREEIQRMYDNGLSMVGRS